MIFFVLCLFHIFYYVHPIKEISLDNFQPFLFTNLQYVIFLRTYRLHAVGVFNIFILKQFKTVGEREKRQGLPWSYKCPRDPMPALLQCTQVRRL